MMVMERTNDDVPTCPEAEEKREQRKRERYDREGVQVRFRVRESGASEEDEVPIL